jgi:hypothetical protein
MGVRGGEVKGQEHEEVGIRGGGEGPEEEVVIEVEAAEEDERAALALEAEQEAEGQPAERSQFLRSDAEWADDLDGHDDELDDYVAAAARR